VDSAPTICPRCGYDLSGHIESWREACPLRGVCSECGLAFRWYDVLRGSLRFPRWSFEHAVGARCFVTFFATLARVFLPRSLWRGLRMEMAFRRFRLVVLVGLSWVLLRATGILLIGLPTLAVVWVSGYGYWDDAADMALWLAWPYSPYGVSYPMRLASPFVAWIALTMLLMPLAFAALPISLRRAKVRRQHIERVALYALAAAPVLAGVFSTLVAAYVSLSAMTSWQTRRALGLSGIGHDQQAIGIIALGVSCVWLWWFWLGATRHYLRLPHAPWVALATLALAFLGAGVVVALGWGHWLFVV
jgi:hypothetical protein